MKRTGAIILAAGASTRLGKSKQLVRIGTENILERSIRIAAEAGCFPVIVVLGASAGLVQEKSNLGGAQIVLNEDWTEGMASSIRIGVKALHEVEGVLIMTCDMPAVTSRHLLALAQPGVIMASSYAGRYGVPAYFPQSIFSALMKLQGDAGARDLLRCVPSIELPGGEVDIDTERDLKIAQERFGWKS